MSWFKRGKVPEKQSQINLAIEINKKANKEIKEKADKVADDFINLLEENHITIKILKAAGGRVNKIKRGTS